MLILLMLYAGLSKLLIEQSFATQLAQSPLIPGPIVPWLAYVLPLGEILVAVMLVTEKFKQFGLHLSFLLMLFFTCYLFTLTILYHNLPCSCGGILGKMNYTTHIIFNIFYTLIALAGILLENIKPIESSL
ncbi:MAG: hypothetical protein K2Q21_12560 [Chitinophagaceae bacterium]|nr:hypothetical protein [Chitinophagaceae bacterium]